jgi:hypothetical protein
VSEIFNNFFINVAKDIGSSNIKSDESRPSISKIIANTPDIENLVFSGNLPNEIDLFTSSEIGFAITGFAIFKILAELPSRPRYDIGRRL